MSELPNPSDSVNLGGTPQPQPGDAPAADCPTPWHCRQAGLTDTLWQVFAANGTLVCTINATSRIALRRPDNPGAIAERIVDAVNALATTPRDADWPPEEVQARAEKRLEALAAQAREGVSRG